MYKIIQPSQEDKIYFGQKQVQQFQQDQEESIYDDISQIPTQLQKEELEQMLDLMPHFGNSKFSQNQEKNLDLWKSIQQIEMRIKEQENNFKRINFEHQEEIKKLKNELNQQKHLYETKIDEIKQSRIQSSNSQIHSPYSTENNREYNYRSNNNYTEVSQEKNYLQQLVQDLKQQIQVLQTKSFSTPYQNDVIWQQKYKQIEQQDKSNIERISHLETQIINQKLFYENDTSKLKKQLDEKNQEEIMLRNQIQQLLQDLNNYKNKFNQVSQTLQQQSQQYQSQIYQLQLQTQKNYSFENKNQNQQLLELTEQLQASTILLEKKIQECEFYKQKFLQQQTIQQNQYIYSHRQSLTPTTQRIQTQNPTVFPISNKQQLFQQFQ
ncbi:unnamed protein product [Paramecium primaurelia]|uniref:Uncharacterized protein n=1 Tax=Paramecium primaurelia TaxID=5886 RepID=A0A8S1MF00_PARPR|nr:unnamed protein product [Paramecium primaurelia]